MRFPTAFSSFRPIDLLAITWRDFFLIAVTNPQPEKTILSWQIKARFRFRAP